VDAPLPILDSGAAFSPCGRYRYRLWRRWRDGPHLLWILLNPSTADAEHNDPTIRRCIGYARDWGFAGIVVVNLFAYRATRPVQLREAPDPVGPAGDRALALAVREPGVGRVMAGWGQHGDWRNRASTVYRMLHAQRPGPILHALGVTARGQPRHPLYCRKSAPPRPWAPPPSA